MVNRKCPYCKEMIFCKTPKHFSSHCGICKKRPGYWESVEKQKQKTLERNGTKWYFFKCKKCQKKYKVWISRYAFEKGNYKKHCSYKCSNSRKHSNITKRKISEALFGNENCKNNVLTNEHRQKIKNSLRGKSKNKGYRIADLKREKNICKKCSSNKNLEIHHKDLNNKNNTWDNLIILCKSCHTKEHYKIGTKTGKRGHVIF